MGSSPYWLGIKRDDKNWLVTINLVAISILKHLSPMIQKQYDKLDQNILYDKRKSFWVNITFAYFMEIC